jgi:hypothetical protein
VPAVVQRRPLAQRLARIVGIKLAALAAHDASVRLSTVRGNIGGNIQIV